MSILDWPATQRPREKLLQSGPASLSDPELLAVFLRVGTPGKSAVELAREMINRFGSLRALLAAPRAEVARIKGVGAAKYAQLQAVVELTRRALAEEMALPRGLESPESVRDYLRLSLANRPYEVFLCLFLDARNRLLAAEELFRGSLTQASVYPREVARQALAHNAASVIVAHNHPSGHPMPSQADIDITRVLARSLALIDVHLLDHFVVAGSHTYSLAEHRQM
ncbi:DNA replication and repair protein RadC [Cupriavidus gilardii J11]|uniref:DNA replication and repair protein RadC n=1 Tax=Cupriavidus gilardii J11 TaxID=936133 RepID=A0A562BKW0_9BURK|nr:DNA repair protein RadC [Cupriavidus gilardii]TWG85796.1 DNA replication and repair protein RadC [Cupriavidus gilardii J11]